MHAQDPRRRRAPAVNVEPDIPRRAVTPRRRLEPPPAAPAAFTWQAIKTPPWAPPELRATLEDWSARAAAVNEAWQTLRSQAEALPAAVASDPEAVLRQAGKLAKAARALAARELALADDRAAMAAAVRAGATAHKAEVMAAHAARVKLIEGELTRLHAEHAIRQTVAADGELNGLLLKAHGLGRAGETLCGLNDGEAARVASVQAWLVSQIGLDLP